MGIKFNFKAEESNARAEILKALCDANITSKIHDRGMTSYAVKQSLNDLERKSVIDKPTFSITDGSYIDVFWGDARGPKLSRHDTSFKIEYLNPEMYAVMLVTES